MQVPANLLEILSGSSIIGTQLFLPATLDRSTYVALDKVLKAAGGSWSPSARAHVFDGSAAEAIDPILLTGQVQRVKQDFGQFYSPSAVVARVIEMALIQPDMRVLEPSAGTGNIAMAVYDITQKLMCVEIDKGNCLAAAERGVSSIVCGDFLRFDPKALGFFDRVVMNPPFARQLDISHVTHAVRFLRPGGRLVSVMSASVTFRQNILTKDFRAFVAQRGGEFEHLPPGSFKASGTEVSAVICAFDAPGAA